MPFRLIPVTIHLSIREWVAHGDSIGGPLGTEIAKRLNTLAYALNNTPNPPLAGDTWETHTANANDTPRPDQRFIVQTDLPDRKPS